MAAVIRWVREHVMELLVLGCLVVAAVAVYARYEPTRDTVIRQTTPCSFDSGSRACADYIARISRDEPLRVTCIRYTRAAAIPFDRCPALLERKAQTVVDENGGSDGPDQRPAGGPGPDQPDSGADPGGGGGDDPPGSPAPPPPDPPGTGGGGGSDPDDPGTGGGGGTPPEPTPPPTLGGLGVQTPLDPTICSLPVSLCAP